MNAAEVALLKDGDKLLLNGSALLIFKRIVDNSVVLALPNGREYTHPIGVLHNATLEP